jgi:hypothetical protein
MSFTWPLRKSLPIQDFPDKQEALMFRSRWAAQGASWCGFLAAFVFFVLGFSLTLGVSRWDPYMEIDWAGVLESANTVFGAQFFLHSFLAFAGMATAVFFAGLAARLYAVHPTSATGGAAFLSIATLLLAVYNVWLAFGHDLVLLRYRSTSDEALRQTFQHLYQAGYLGTPVLAAVMAYFAIPGFLLLGRAFRGRRDAGSLWFWCWASAATLVFGVLALGYGYDRTFGANQMPRTLMIWGNLALWVFPTVTTALGASWLWREGIAQGERSRPRAEKPLDAAA